MQTSMATVSLGGTLVEKIEAIAAAGFDGIELLDADLRGAGMSSTECAHRCADLGLAIDLYQPFRRAEGVSDTEFRAVVERFRVALHTVAELGADAILVVSNTDGDADPDRDRSVAQVAALADVAAGCGVTVMYEALAWGTHIDHVADAWEVVRRGDRPNLKVVIDTFHHLAVGENPAVVAGIPGESIGFLQIADAPWERLDTARTPPALMQWSRGHRCFPGEGNLALYEPTATVVAAGYRGPLSLEIFNPGYRRQAPHVVAQRGFDSLRLLADRLSVPASANGAANHGGAA